MPPRDGGVAQLLVPRRENSQGTSEELFLTAQKKKKGQNLKGFRQRQGLFSVSPSLRLSACSQESSFRLQRTLEQHSIDVTALGQTGQTLECVHTSKAARWRHVMVFSVSLIVQIKKKTKVVGEGESGAAPL